MSSSSICVQHKYKGTNLECLIFGLARFDYKPYLKLYIWILCSSVCLATTFNFLSYLYFKYLTFSFFENS